MNKQIISDRKAAVYLRVGSKSQFSPSESLDRQENEVRRYCEKQNLTIESSLFKRCVGSGKNVRSRNSVLNLFDKIRTSNVKHIVLHSYERWSRTLPDFSFLADFAKANDVTVHVVKDKLVIDRVYLEDTFKKIDEEYTQEYKKRLSEKIAVSRRMKAETGWFPGRPPLGYETKKEVTSSGRTQSIICISPNKEVIARIRREFTLAAQGIPLSKVQEQLILEAFIPRSKQTRWELHSLRRRLLNPFYLGRFNWEGTEYEGKHELIPDVAEAARLIQTSEVSQ